MQIVAPLRQGLAGPFLLFGFPAQLQSLQRFQDHFRMIAQIVAHDGFDRLLLRRIQCLFGGGGQRRDDGGEG